MDLLKSVTVFVITFIAVSLQLVCTPTCTSENNFIEKYRERDTYSVYYRALKPGVGEGAGAGPNKTFKYHDKKKDDNIFRKLVFWEEF